MTAPPASDRPDALPLVRLLLVDDDEDDYLLTRDLVAEMPNGRYALEWVREYEAGRARIVAGEHDVFLIDYRIGARTGLDLLAETRGTPDLGPMILLTGQGELEIDQAAMQAGAADYLEKSRLDATLLERSIRYALRQRRTEQELEHKVAERTESLKTANAALRDADRRKDEFLATLAHELRNPLSPVRNALEIMRLGGYAPGAAQAAYQIMDRQVRTMVRLIDDLMDISRLTRGMLTLSVEPTDVAHVVGDALEAARPMLDKAGLTFHVDVAPGPLPVLGDRVRLAQVFTNILANAAKYTEPGGEVWLTLRRDGADAVGTIRDTGPGIPAELLPKIFDLFTQIDRTLNRAQGGLGIGLALVRQLVELHRGQVTAESAGAGRGSQFTVRLPLEV